MVHACFPSKETTEKQVSIFAEENRSDMIFNFLAAILMSCLFGVITDASTLFVTTSLLLSLILVQYHSVHDVAHVIYMQCLGYLIEITGVLSGEWVYPSKPIGGIPLWFLTMWGSVGFFSHRLVFPIISELTKSKSGEDYVAELLTTKYSSSSTRSEAPQATGSEIIVDQPSTVASVSGSSSSSSISTGSSSNNTIFISDDEVEEIDRFPSEYHIQTRFGNRINRKTITNEQISLDTFSLFIHSIKDVEFNKLLQDRQDSLLQTLSGEKDKEVRKKLLTKSKSPKVRKVEITAKALKILKVGMESLMIETFKKANDTAKANTISKGLTLLTGIDSTQTTPKAIHKPNRKIAKKQKSKK